MDLEKVDFLTEIDSLRRGWQACEARLAAVEAERDAARAAPEPIGEKHKDGNWWLVWDENIGAWCKARWDLGWGQWDLDGYVWVERTPTHALPLPPAPEVLNA